MTINKAAGGLEDLTLGMETEVQIRKGEEVYITQVNAGHVPYTETLSVADKLAYCDTKFTQYDTLSSTVPGKADKVIDGVENHLASLDSEGNLLDSGFSADEIDEARVAAINAAVDSNNSSIASEASYQSAIEQANIAIANKVITAENVVITNADVVTTNENVTTTTENVDSTNADVVLTHADVETTTNHVGTTNSNVLITNADVVTTNADVLITNADVVTTNADVLITNADVVTTNADVVTTNADVVTVTALAGQVALNASAAEASADSSLASSITSTNGAANSLNSANAAYTSSLNAALSESNASASEVSTANKLNTFQTSYLGDKASDPSLDNEGNPLKIGALYFNTVYSLMKMYSGTEWIISYASAAGSLLSSNNLSDLSNIEVSRSNLELGTENDVNFTSATIETLNLESSSPSYAEGRIFYNSDSGALNVYNDAEDITLQVGQEELVRVYNNSGSLIANGKIIYFSSSYQETPVISLANASIEAASQAEGITTHDIPNNSFGYVTVRGVVNELDLSSFSVADRLYVSTTAGELTNIVPTYPYYPCEVGGVLSNDSETGSLYFRTRVAHLEYLRVCGNSHLDGNLTVDGDLIVQGTQSIISQNNLSISDNFIYLSNGDTIGEENTSFSGSGLNDGYFTGHFEGTSTLNYYVRIDGTGTPDTFEWSLDNFSTTEATGIGITGENQELSNGINIRFNSTIGHSIGDIWSGSASPLNIDSGWVSNRNTGTTGVGYTHVGMIYDVSDDKFKYFSAYAPEPEGTIDTEDASFVPGTVAAGVFEGSFSGNLTGDVTGNSSTANEASQALKWSNARSLTVNGDVSGVVSLDGTSNVTMTTTVQNNSHNHLASNITDLQPLLDAKVSTSAYTATDVLTKLKTVDGSGSGLDADLLDGHNSSYFLASSSYTAADVLSKIKTVDGAGSGLDADLLDGHDTSYFATSTHNHSGVYLPVGSKAADSDLFDGLDNTQFLKVSTDATITSKIIVGSSNRDGGMYGTYDSTKTQSIWSMGTAYTNSPAGTNFGNLYGLAYKHTDNTTGGTLAGGHQMVWCQNGTAKAAMGDNIWASGNVTAYSDIRVKTNIEVIPNAISKVQKLSGYTFDRTDIAQEDTATRFRQTGVIAQEVLEVLPEAVVGGPTEEDPDGHYSVAYGNMIGLLIEAIKEQQEQIDSLTGCSCKTKD